MSINKNNESTTQMADKKWFIVMAIVLGCFAFSPSQAGADTWLERQNLLSSDGAVNDQFGCVSISGDYAIVGAPLDDDKGTDSGSAYIFKWDGTIWVEQQKLTASDGAAGDRFGWFISISGDYAIVGAFYGDSGKGSAYIFKWDGTIWVEQQKLTASDGAAFDQFGCSVSISGDYAIVGARQDDDKGTYSGSAYVFKWDGTIWVEQQKLTASDGAVNDLFGVAVSVNGDCAIVGANRDDDNGTDSGSAYIFKWDGTIWIEQQKLTASDGAVNDQFGCSVSISGDYAIVGAYYDDDKGTDSGSAYIFKWDGTSWVRQQKLTASDGAVNDIFGVSVSISGDYAIVGARLDDDKGDNSGSAYIFKFCPRADLDDDCKVDFADFAIFADWWLYGTD